MFQCLVTPSVMAMYIRLRGVSGLSQNGARGALIVYLWSNIADGGWGCRRSIGWSCPSRLPRGPGWSAWSVCGTFSSEVPRLQSETRLLGYRVTLPLAPSVLAGPGKRKENNWRENKHFNAIAAPFHTLFEIKAGNKWEKKEKWK